MPIFPPSDGRFSLIYVQLGTVAGVAGGPPSPFEGFVFVPECLVPLVQLYGVP